MDCRTIEQLIRAGIPDSRVSVTSEDQVHFHATVVSAAFEGEGRIARHRRVHGVFGPELGREIHALSLDLKTPAEDRAEAAL